MRVLVRDGLFSDTDPPALLGSHCLHCGSTLFPRTDTCAYCATEGPEAVELSRAGTLWAWTAVTAPPPGYTGDVPYGVGVVELPEGVRVIGRLTESDPAALSAGQPMELRVVLLHQDADGNDVVTYAFAPTPASASASAAATAAESDRVGS
ncbi:MAG TPA: OB-fold domain-containing protein [Acidimicrobiales bacterium]|nr:OB-fold domain-containing protein [Acidimicrobiales bacterium]